MKQLFLQVTYVNDTSGGITHVGDIEETTVKSLSDLYRSLRRNYKGRITKMYRDGGKGEAIHIGYIVTSKQVYDRTDETFIGSEWYELLESVKVMREVTEYIPFNSKAS